jgi:hypothetical protein
VHCVVAVQYKRVEAIKKISISDENYKNREYHCAASGYVISNSDEGYLIASWKVIE